MSMVNGQWSMVNGQYINLMKNLFIVHSSQENLSKKVKEMVVCCGKLMGQLFIIYFDKTPINIVFVN